jgi:hypothetical protein
MIRLKLGGVQNALRYVLVVEESLTGLTPAPSVLRRQGAFSGNQVHGSEAGLRWRARIPVATVQRHLRQGCAVNEILAAYPELTPADVEAARQDRVVA